MKMQSQRMCFLVAGSAAVDDVADPDVRMKKERAADSTAVEGAINRVQVVDRTKGPSPH